MTRASLALLLFLSASTPSAAQAQHHHHSHSGQPSGDDTAPSAIESESSRLLHAGLHFEVGQAEAFGAERDYQGIALMIGVRRGRFELGLHLPTYRIELGDAVGRGLGDMHLMGRWIALQRENAELGLSAGVMPPFGDDKDGIGMGHSMIMVGGFGRWNRDRFHSRLTLAYGTSLGAAGHREHGVLVWPSVSPMNAQELRTTAQVGLDLGHHFGISLSGLGAIPIGEGAFLALAGAEMSYQFDRYTLGLGARHGLAAHTAGLVLSSSLMAIF